MTDPDLVDTIKAHMRDGTYRFRDPDGHIGGLLDDAGVYHVMEGHHQIVLVNDVGRNFARDDFFKEGPAHRRKCGGPKRNP